MTMMFELWSDLRPEGLKRDKMVNLWVKWPKLGSNWPKEGSFKPKDLAALKVILQKKGQWKPRVYLTWWEVSRNRQLRYARQMLCEAKRKRNNPDEMEELLFCSQGSRQRYTEEAESNEEENAKEHLQRTTKEIERLVAEQLAKTPERRLTRNSKIQAPMRAIPVATAKGVEDCLVYVPFTTTDLFNWRETTPRLRDDAEKVYERFCSIIRAYDPTWGDCVMLMDNLLKPDEELSDFLTQ